MQDNYFLIDDNISEIISIVYSSQISFQICTAVKSIFHNFFNIPMIHVHFYLRYPGSLQLSKFKQVKELNFGKHFRLNESYNQQFVKLTNIHSLKIECKITRPSKLYLTSLIKLSSLYFHDREIGKINFSNSSIRKLTAFHNENNSMFQNCYNIEELNLRSDYAFDLFKMYTYTNLTKLILMAYYCSYPIHFHQNYYDHIIELSVNDRNINFDKKEWCSLTSLTILNVCKAMKLHTMYNLKSLFLQKAHRSNVEVIVENTPSLKSLYLRNFEWLQIEKNQSMPDVNQEKELYDLNDIFQKMKESSATYPMYLKSFRLHDLAWTLVGEQMDKIDLAKQQKNKTPSHVVFPKCITNLETLDIEFKNIFSLDTSCSDKLSRLIHIKLNDKIFDSIPKNCV